MRNRNRRLEKKYREIPFFSQWSMQDLARLDSVATRMEFEPGEVISRDITTGYEFVILTLGRAVVVGGALQGTVVTVGEHLGEMSIFSELRSTSVLVATTFSTALLMSELDFRGLLGDTPPLAMALTASLSRRLSKTFEGAIPTPRTA